jgi:hypothetical protein
MKDRPGWRGRAEADAAPVAVIAGEPAKAAGTSVGMGSQPRRSCAVRDQQCLPSPFRVRAPPAYANRHVFARSDKERVCAGLAR